MILFQVVDEQAEILIAVCDTLESAEQVARLWAETTRRTTSVYELEGADQEWVRDMVVQRLREYAAAMGLPVKASPSPVGAAQAALRPPGGTLH